jgi:hypothetical protein
MPPIVPVAPVTSVRSWSFLLFVIITGYSNECYWHRSGHQLFGDHIVIVTPPIPHRLVDRTIASTTTMS